MMIEYMGSGDYEGLAIRGGMEAIFKNKNTCFFSNHGSFLLHVKCWKILNNTGKIREFHSANLVGTLISALWWRGQEFRPLDTQYLNYRLLTTPLQKSCGQPTVWHQYDNVIDKKMRHFKSVIESASCNHAVISIMKHGRNKSRRAHYIE